MEFAKLVRQVRQVRLLSPPAFAEDSQTIEYREDPLTGVRCRINTRRTSRPKQAQQPADLSEIVAKPPNCPFCPENIEAATPRFPADLCPPGHIQRGQCRLFPNLFPFAERHATATLTEEHFLPLNRFEARSLADNLAATLEYLTLVQQRDPELNYPLYIWNHLPPSAASIVHPHVQILVDRRPTAYQQRLLEASRDYLDQTGESFWRELVREERRLSERFIGENSSVSVLASYAPQGNREVLIIFKEASSLADLDSGQVTDFAAAVVRLLGGYHQMEVNSFNLSTFSAPCGDKLDHYSLHAKLISRPVFQPWYRNDTGVLERLHYEADIEMEPEEVAASLRACFLA